MYYHCKFEFGAAIVIAKYDTVVPKEENVDFVTGDLSPQNAFLYERYTIFATNGTTIDVAVAATDTTIPIAATTDMNVGERVAIELDTGEFHTAWIEEVNAADSIVISDEMPSAASITNGVISATQMEGDILGSIVEDFKIPKVRAIDTRTEFLRNHGFRANNRRFPLSPRNLATVRKVDDYRVPSGDSYTVTNATKSDPVSVTVSDVTGLEELALVTIDGVVGQTELNGNQYYASNIDGGGNKFDLLDLAYNPVDGLSHTAYVSGGTVTEGEETPTARSRLIVGHEPLLDINGREYRPTTFAQAEAITDAVATRISQLSANSLLTSVTFALNTQAAMDAIVDNRT